MQTLLQWRPAFVVQPILLMLLSIGLAGGMNAQACTADAGELSLDIDQDFVVLCTDDEEPDVVNVNLEGASGQGTWVITTPYGIIIDQPAGPPFDFTDAEDGTCFIFYLVTGTPFTGAVEIGDNVCTLTPSDGCWDLSNYVRVTKVSGDDCIEPCEAEAGNITFFDGGGQSFVCVDGMNDEVEIIRSGATAGDEFTFIITDTDGNIVDIPAGDGPFDFEAYNGEFLLAYYIAVDEDLIGLEIGGNLDDLNGCFELSNPLTIVRQEPNGGELEGGPFEFCVGDSIPDFIPEGAITVSGATGTNQVWVITDADANILGIPGDYSDVNFDDAGPGTCLVWYLSFEDGLEGAVVGNNAADLEGCFDLSNPIEVIRNQPDGGELEGGPFAFCGEDGIEDLIFPDDITVSGATGSNQVWVITDTDATILAIAEDLATIDFDAAPAGTYLVWYLAFEDGLEGAEIDNNAADLEGCFDLSNPIEVVVSVVDGGELEGGPFEFCVGDSIPDFIPADAITLSGAVGTNQAWVITDAEANILAIVEDFSIVDFNEAEPGTCLIWYIAFEDGLEGAEPGNNAADLVGCFNLSNPIEVIRVECEEPCEVDGGELEGGPFTFCVGDSIPDVIPEGAITLSGAFGTNQAWVITDAEANILGIVGDYTEVDFDDAPAGSCLVWYISFEDGLQGAEPGANAADLVGCFDLSNPIEVIRLEGDDCEEPCEVNPGEITFPNGNTVCLGDSSIVEIEFVTEPSGDADFAIGFVFDSSGFLVFTITEDLLGSSFQVPGNYTLVALVGVEATFDPASLDSVFTIGDLDNLSGCYDLTNFLEFTVSDDDECGPPPLVPGIMDEEFAQGCMEDQLGGEVFLSVANPDELSNYVIVVVNSLTGEIVGIGEENNPFYTYDPFGIPGLFLGGVITYDPNNFGGLVVGENINDLSGDFVTSDEATNIVIGNAGSGCIDPYNYCENNADEVQLLEPGAELCFCVEDGEDDLLAVEFVDPSLLVGDNFQIVLLSGYTVVAVADENGVFNFEGTTPGEFYEIAGIATNGFTLEVGDELNQISFENCYARSFNTIGGVFLFGGADCSTNLTITEVMEGGSVEITNFGSKFVGVGGYSLVAGNQRYDLSELDIECGDLTLAPNETVVLRSPAGFGMIGDEMALFVNEDITDYNNLIDYVRWGGGSSSMVPLAVMAEQWDPTISLPNPMADQSLQLFIDDESNESWSLAGPSPCELNSPLAVIDLATGFGFELFPNPVGGRLLNVKVSEANFDELVLEVIDQSGRRVNIGWNTVNAGLLQLEVSELPTGVYYLRMTDGQTSLTDRFVVQR